MRTVLHLINTAGPGGAETVYHGLVTGLAPERWRALAVVPNEGWITEHLRAEGHAPIVLRSRRRLDLEYMGGLLRLIRQEGVDLVHSHYFGPSITASVLGRLAGVPVVGTLHGTGDMAEHESLAALKGLVLRHGLTRLVFVSAALRDAFEGRVHIDPARVRVIENGVMPAFFETCPSPGIRTALGATPDTFLVGAVGNVRPAKGYEILLRAMSLLMDVVAGVQLVIAGQGSDTDFAVLGELARQLGVEDRVRFLGFRGDLPALLPCLDAFALSSHSEGFSLAVVQAMAASLPVVATRCGGPETILEDEVTGLLVPTGSPEALAAALAGLARDRARASQLGTAARAHASARYTVERQVRRYEELYLECLGADAGAAVPLDASMESPA